MCPVLAKMRFPKQRDHFNQKNMIKRAAMSSCCPSSTKPRTLSLKVVKYDKTIHKTIHNRGIQKTVKALDPTVLIRSLQTLARIYFP